MRKIDERQRKIALKGAVSPRTEHDELMDYTHRADLLRGQAKRILDTYSLGGGGVTLTGSCFLNLMVCPDIDVHIRKDTITDMFQLARELYLNNSTNEIYIQKGETLNEPDADHIQVRTNISADQGRWKIDIWLLPEKALTANMDEMTGIARLLDEKSRTDILKIKTTLLQKNGFTPKNSSYHVYRAYFYENLRDPCDIKRYLVAEGVVLE